MPIRRPGRIPAASVSAGGAVSRHRLHAAQALAWIREVRKTFWGARGEGRVNQTRRRTSVVWKTDSGSACKRRRQTRN